MNDFKNYIKLIPSRYSYLDRLAVLIAYPFLFTFKKFNLDPGRISILGSIFGGASIGFALSDNVKLTFLCIFARHYLDCFDGHYARYSKKTSEFGKKLDILCDFTIGILMYPIVFGYISYKFLNNIQTGILLIMSLVTNELVGRYWNIHDPTSYCEILIYIFIMNCINKN